MSDSLWFDSLTRAQLWRELTEVVEAHLTHVDEQGVAPPLDEAELRALLRPYTFANPRSPHELLRELDQALRRHQVHTAHRRYFGLFNPAPSVMGIAADTLVATLNPQLAAFSHSPLAVAMEHHLIAAFGMRFGLPPERCDGVFTGGGSEANLTAVCVALAHRWPALAERGLRALPADPVCYVSAEAHHSILKAARITGLGTAAVRQVPVDEALRLDLSRLRQLIAEDRAQGRAPFLLVGTVGTTGTGVIDPLPALAEIAAAEQLWFHVDAAWGGAVQLSARWQHLLAGIERADSITFDAHKWLSVPMGAGMLLTRHRAALAQAFALEASYMPKEGDPSAPDPFARSLQWSRRFIGLKVFMTLAATGWGGYARVVDDAVALGDELRRRLRAAGWRLVNETPLPVVCFTRAGEDWSLAQHQALVNAVLRSGAAWISTITTSRGQPAIRAGIANFRTTAEDLDALVTALERAR